MSNENKRKRVRLSRSLSVPSRKKIPRQTDEDDSGFRTVTRGYTCTYDHDTSAIRLTTTNLKKYAKNLEKLHKDIERKEQKTTSKQLSVKKKDYETCLSDIQHELWELNRIFLKEEPKTLQKEKTDVLTETKTEISRCDNCFTNEKDKMQLYAEIDRLKETLHAERAAKEEALVRLKETVHAERAAKEEALIRLSSYTASKLRDNNPNLTDLSDPCRPSKIAEMFSELYDDEWTDAFDELRKKNTEDEAIKKLNDLVMEAFNICGKLTEPLRLYLDTTSTKIDIKLRQKMLDHIKQKADIIIPKLKQNIVEEISKCHCIIRDSNSKDICRYIDKTIEICWLMMIQDPPMHLYNTKTDKFDSKKYREYQNKGPCTAYIVWPAITLHKDGAMLSKGVAEGTKGMANEGDVVNNVKVQTGSDDQENVNDRAKQV